MTPMERSRKRALKRFVVVRVESTHADLPWSGQTPKWARRAAHHCGRIARGHSDPGSNDAHHEMLVAIMREYENREGRR